MATSQQSGDFLRHVEENWGKLMPNLCGWRCTISPMSGSWCWDKEGEDVEVYATPFWETDGIPVESVSVSEGEWIESVCLPFQLTGDHAADARAYRKLIRPFLSRMS